MKVTQMPPVHAANLLANNGNTAYGVDVIGCNVTCSINISGWCRRRYIDEYARESMGTFLDFAYTLFSIYIWIKKVNN